MVINENDNCVDFFKLLFSLFVVAIHAKLLSFPESGLSERVSWYLVHMLLRLAVPFFFVTSGYFYGNKFWKVCSSRDGRLAICKKYIIRLTPPLVFWGTLGIVPFAITTFQSDKSFKMLRIMQLAIFYPKGATWFVAACILAVLIISLFWENKRCLMVFAVLGYVFAMLCNSYYFVIQDTFLQKIVDLYMKVCISARNGVFVGLLYIGIGMWLSKPQNIIERLTSTRLVFFLALLYVCLFLEVTFCYGKPYLDDTSLFISMPLFSALLLELLLRTSAKYSTKVSLIMRRLSVYMYFLHPVFNNVFNRTWNGFRLAPVFVFVLDVTGCCIVYLLTKNSKNKFIRMILP